MPFIEVLIPEDVPESRLLDMCSEMIIAVSTLIPNVPLDYVQPYCFRDLLGNSLQPGGKSRVVAVKLLTGLFDGLEDVETIAPAVTESLARIVSDAFLNRRDVECVVVGLEAKWTKFVPSQPE